MKKFAFFIIFFSSIFCLTAQETEINGCRITVYHSWDKKSSTSFDAYGNVFIETDPHKPVDLEVKIVDSPQKATYNVYKTTDTPQKCGEWRFVSDRSKAKFTIRYVKDWEDCHVYFTNDRNKAGF